MDNKRRSRLREAIGMLSNATTVVEAVCDKEQDCMDNCPENLQGSERYERMEDAVDNLNDALERLEEAKEYIEAAIK